MEHWRNVSLDLIRQELDGILYVEEFRPVTGFEGYYEISSFGRLKKLGRPYKTKQEWKSDRISLATFTTKRGKKRYLKFNMMAAGKKQTSFAHRLVGLHFLEPIEGKDQINHKTGVKTDNHYSQIEWSTQEENNDHAVAIGLAKRGQKPRKPYEKKGYRIGVKEIINIKTGERYAHALEFSQKTGISIRSIRRSLSGERYNHTDFRYVGQEDVCKVMEKRVFKKDILQPLVKLNAAGVEIERFSDVKELDKVLRQRVGAFLNGRSESVDGFFYKKISPDGSFIDPPKFVSRRKERPKSENLPPAGKVVIKRDEVGNELGRFDSLRRAAYSMEVDVNNFKKMLKKGRPGYYKGFFWEVVG